MAIELIETPENMQIKPKDPEKQQQEQQEPAPGPEPAKNLDMKATTEFLRNNPGWVEKEKEMEKAAARRRARAHRRGHPRPIEDPAMPIKVKRAFILLLEVAFTLFWLTIVLMTYDYAMERAWLDAEAEINGGVPLALNQTEAEAHAGHIVDALMKSINVDQLNLKQVRVGLGIVVGIMVLLLCLIWRGLHQPCRFKRLTWLIFQAIATVLLAIGWTTYALDNGLLLGSTMTYFSILMSRFILIGFVMGIDRDLVEAQREWLKMNAAMEKVIKKVGVPQLCILCKADHREHAIATAHLMDFEMGLPFTPFFVNPRRARQHEIEVEEERAKRGMEKKIKMDILPPGIV